MILVKLLIMVIFVNLQISLPLVILINLLTLLILLNLLIVVKQVILKNSVSDDSGNFVQAGHPGELCEYS